MPLTSRSKSVQSLILLLASMLAADVACSSPVVRPPPLSTAGGQALESALVGEFALQEGDVLAAAQAYLQAAIEDGTSPELAERAARLALLANERAMAEAALSMWQQLSPQAPGVWAGRSVLALSAGDGLSAVPYLLPLLADVRPEARLFAVGALRSASGQPAAVAEAMAAVLAHGVMPADVGLWQAFGQLAIELQQPALSRTLVSAAAVRFPGEPRLLLIQARQRHEDGNTAGAVSMLAPLHVKAGRDVALRQSLASLYEVMQRWDLGARVMALGRQDTDSYALRAAFLVRQQDTRGLALLLRQVAADSRRPEPSRLLLLGKLAEYLGDTDQALEWYRRVTTGPALAEARVRSIMVLLQAGRHHAALGQVQRLQRDVSLDAIPRRDAHVLEVELYRRLGRDEDMLAALQRGLAAHPGDGTLLYARALYWERYADLQRSEQDLRQILVATPDHARALNALGYLLADRSDRLDEALALIRRALLVDPDNPAVIDSHGWVLYRLGRLEEALPELRRAWSLSRDVEIGAHFGFALHAAGQWAPAQDVLRHLLAINPDNPLVQQLRDRLSP